MRLPAIILAALAFAIPALASAQSPEQLDQLEPGAGAWQAEYFGTFGPGGAREHALEAMFGLNDRLAVGVELEVEYENGGLAFDTLGVKALYRLTGDEAPVALGAQVQLDFDDRAVLAQAETRLIAEVETEAWWGQANVMLRRSRDEGETATGFAYAWSLQHKMGSFAWLGIEGSGQSAALWRSDGASASPAHFTGPSLTIEWQPAGAPEIEVGFAYFRRVGGVGPRDSGRVFIQTTF